MNCDCIAEVEKKLNDHLVEQKKLKKKILSVRLQEVLMRSSGLELKSNTYTTLLISLEGQKKKATMNISHSFCPFCGVAIEPNRLS